MREHSWSLTPQWVISWYKELVGKEMRLIKNPTDSILLCKIKTDFSQKLLEQACLVRILGLLHVT
jgi:hypothetical protein